MRRSRPSAVAPGACSAPGPPAGGAADRDEPGSAPRSTRSTRAHRRGSSGGSGPPAIRTSNQRSTRRCGWPSSTLSTWSGTTLSRASRPSPRSTSPRCGRSTTRWPRPTRPRSATTSRAWWPRPTPSPSTWTLAGRWPRWRSAFLDLFGRVELLALPTLPIFPPRCDELVADSLLPTVIELTRHVSPFNAAGTPCSAQPVPVEGGRLPASLQLVGPLGGEELLLTTAQLVESAVAGEVSRARS
jgi:hypothetical protein